MLFTDALTNRTTTLNGAPTNKSSFSAVLDLFSMGVSASLPQKAALIKAAFIEHPLLALKVVFYLRDCRGGQGNKDILQILFSVLDDLHFAIPYIPEFGSFKDLRKLYAAYPIYRTAIVNTFVTELKASNNLAGKWAPRRGELAQALTTALGLTPRQYRKLIVKLSTTVEQLMCARDWSGISYKAVPSCANKLYAKAFWKHDADRYGAFVKRVISGEVKMHSSQLYPHEILNIITHGDGYNTRRPAYEASKSADALWKSLPNYMTEARNVLPVIDMSGSMTSIAYSKISCMDIAMGLGIYFAEHNTGSYKNLWCHFSDHIHAQYLQGSTLSEYLTNMDRSGMGYSTNIQAIFDFILANHARTSDLPEVVLIVSDMEFNNTSVGGNRTNFQVISDKFKAAGVKMPLLVFWRVDIKQIQQPVILDDKNTILLNGYSPAVCKAIFQMDFDSITPYSMMIQALGTKYDKIVANYNA